MEFDAHAPGFTFYRPYVNPHSIENKVLDVDLKIVTDSLANKFPSADPEKLTNRIRDHYIDSIRLIKRSFGEVHEEDFQHYNWGLILTQDVSLDTDKLELLMLTYSKTMPRRSSLLDFQEIMQRHTSFRFISDRKERREKWLDLVMSFKLNATSKKGYPDSIGKREFALIVHVNQLEMDVDIIRLINDLRKMDAYSNRLHMLLVNDPLISGYPFEVEDLSLPFKQPGQKHVVTRTERMIAFEKSIEIEEQESSSFERKLRLQVQFDAEKQLNEQRIARRKRREAEMAVLKAEQDAEHAAKLARLAEIIADREAHEERKRKYYEEKALAMHLKDLEDAETAKAVMEAARNDKNDMLSATFESTIDGPSAFSSTYQGDEDMLDKTMRPGTSQLQYDGADYMSICKDSQVDDVKVELSEEEKLKARFAAQLQAHKEGRRQEKLKEKAEMNKLINDKLTAHKLQLAATGGEGSTGLYFPPIPTASSNLSSGHTTKTVGQTKPAAVPGDKSAYGGTLKQTLTKARSETPKAVSVTSATKPSTAAQSKPTPNQVSTKPDDTTKTISKSRKESQSPPRTVTVEKEDLDYVEGGTADTPDDLVQFLFDGPLDKVRLERLRLKGLEEEAARQKHIQEFEAKKAAAQTEAIRKKAEEEEIRIKKHEEAQRAKALRAQRIAEQAEMKRLEEEIRQEELAKLSVEANKQEELRKQQEKRKKEQREEEERVFFEAEKARKQAAMKRIREEEERKKQSTQKALELKEARAKANLAALEAEKKERQAKAAELRQQQIAEKHLKQKHQEITLQQIPPTKHVDQGNISILVETSDEVGSGEANDVRQESASYQHISSSSPNLGYLNSDAVPDTQQKLSAGIEFSTPPEAPNNDDLESLRSKQPSPQPVDVGRERIASVVLMPDQPIAYDVPVALSEDKAEVINSFMEDISFQEPALLPVRPESPVNWGTVPEPTAATPSDENIDDHEASLIPGDDADDYSEISLDTGMFTGGGQDPALDDLIDDVPVTPVPIGDKGVIVSKTSDLLEAAKGVQAVVHKVSAMVNEHVDANRSSLGLDQVNTPPLIPPIAIDNIDQVSVSSRPGSISSKQLSPSVLKLEKFGIIRAGSGYEDQEDDNQPSDLPPIGMAHAPYLETLFALPFEDIEVVVPKTNGELRLFIRHDDEGDRHGLFVHGFKPGSKAESEGLIRIGDEVIEVDHKNVKGQYLQAIVDILQGNHDDNVVLKVHRRVFDADTLQAIQKTVSNPVGSDSDEQSFADYSYKTIDSLESSELYDTIFAIVPLSSDGQLRVVLRHIDDGSTRPGLYLHDFKPNSPAQRQGILHVGDEIVAVNEVVVQGLFLEDVVRALKGVREAGEVSIVIRRLKEPKPQALLQVASPRFIRDQYSPVDVLGRVISGATTRTFEIPRVNGELNLTLQHREVGEESAIVLVDFKPGYPAKQQNLLHIGDEIISVDGTSLEGKPLAQIAQILREGRSNASSLITIRRGLPNVDGDDSSIRKDLFPAEECDEDANDAIADVHYEQSIDQMQNTGRHGSDDESTFVPIEVSVPKVQGQLRIAMQHIDAGHYRSLVVHGFLPNCPAERQGIVKIGDELVSVDGISVEGKHREDVVKILMANKHKSHADLVLRRYDLNLGEESSVGSSESAAKFEKKVSGPISRPESRVERPISTQPEGTSLETAHQHILNVISNAYDRNSGLQRSPRGVLSRGVSPRAIRPDSSPASARADSQTDRSQSNTPPKQRAVVVPIPDINADAHELLLAGNILDIAVPKTDGELRVLIRHDDVGDMHGLFVHGIRPNSKAREQGALRPGDEIIAVDGVLVEGGYLDAVIEILMRNNSDVVVLTIRRTPGGHGITDDFELGSAFEHVTKATDVVDFIRSKPSSPEPIDEMFAKRTEEILDIAVPKTNGELRVLIRYDDVGDMHGLFVHGIRPNSKAREQGALRPGDEVIAVDGIAVQGQKLDALVKVVVKNKSDTVAMKIRRVPGAHGMSDEFDPTDSISTRAPTAQQLIQDRTPKKPDATPAIAKDISRTGTSTTPTTTTAKNASPSTTNPITSSEQPRVTRAETKPATVLVSSPIVAPIYDVSDQKELDVSAASTDETIQRSPDTASKLPSNSVIEPILAVSPLSNAGATVDSRSNADSSDVAVSTIKVDSTPHAPPASMPLEQPTPIESTASIHLEVALPSELTTPIPLEPIMATPLVVTTPLKPTSGQLVATTPIESTTSTPLRATMPFEPTTSATLVVTTPIEPTTSTPLGATMPFEPISSTPAVQLPTEATKEKPDSLQSVRFSSEVAEASASLPAEEDANNVTSSTIQEIQTSGFDANKASDSSQRSPAPYSLSSRVPASVLAPMPTYTTHKYRVVKTRGELRAYIKGIIPESTSDASDRLQLHTDEDNQIQNQRIRFVVQGFLVGSKAVKQGHLRKGDEIIAVEGDPVASLCSNVQELSAVLKARGTEQYIDLTIRRLVSTDA